MIEEKDILFITTSMNNKWAEYSRQLVSKNFPNSEHIIIDGSRGWWQVWFHWISKLTNRSEKYVILLDDDAFITNKDEILRLVNIMDDENYSICGAPDGHNHTRGTNPISVCPFFMISNIEHLLKSWDGDMNRKFKPEWIEEYKDEYEKGFIDDVYVDGELRHKMSHDFCDLSFNPWSGDIWYPLTWSILDNGYKIKYLHPNYGGSELESTNPSILKGDPEFLIHMWHTRDWQTPQHIHRYELVEKILKEKYL